MKKSLSIAAAIILSLFLQPEVQAQKWTAGLRTGFTQDQFQFNDQFAQGHNLMWHNQVFVDYRLNKCWELELAIGYNQLENNSTYSDSEEPSVIFYQEWKTRYLTTSLNIKYYFLQKGKLGVFAQAGLGSTKSRANFKTHYTGTLKPFSMYQNMPRSDEGVSETNWPRLTSIGVGTDANYNLTSHLHVSGLFQLSYKTDLNNGYGAYSINQSDFFPVLVAGIGYRF